MSPVAAILITCFIVVFNLCGLVGMATMDVKGILGFYMYPFSFRWRSHLLVVGCLVISLGLLAAFRHLIETSERRRHPRCVSTVPTQAAAALLHI